MKIGTEALYAMIRSGMVDKAARVSAMEAADKLCGL